MHKLLQKKKGAPVAHSLPGKANGNGDSRKNDRDRNTLTTGRTLRVLSFQAVDSLAKF